MSTTARTMTAIEENGATISNAAIAERLPVRGNRQQLAHDIAHWIEWQHAKQLSMAVRGRQSAEWFYDPLAATCLGDLLYERLCVTNRRLPDSGDEA